MMEMKMKKEVSGAQLLRMCKALPNYKDTVEKFTRIWFSRTPGRLWEVQTALNGRTVR